MLATVEPDITTFAVAGQQTQAVRLTSPAVRPDQGGAGKGVDTSVRWRVARTRLPPGGVRHVGMIGALVVDARGPLRGVPQEVFGGLCGSPRIVEGFPMRLPGREPRCSRS